MPEWITQLDFNLLYRIQDGMRCGFLDFLMPKITLFGNSGALWIIIAVALLFQKKYRKHGILLLAGLLIGAVVGNLILKNLFMRPRPCWLDPSVRLLISVPKDYAFPSGHTLSSVVAATILTATNRRFAWAAIPLAALISFSRLYLFVHFPSDVVAAVILGIAIGFLVLKIGKRLLRIPQE